MRVDAGGLPPKQPLAPSADAGLATLARASLSGDWFSDCMGLSACGASEQFGMQRQNLKRSHRALQQYQQRIEELRVEQQKKAERASSWGFWGSVVGVVSTVVGAVVSLYCPGAGGLLGFLGGSSASYCGAVAEDYGDLAAGDHARAMKMSAMKADVAADGAQQLRMIDAMIAMEQRMGRRLLSLLGTEKQAAEVSLRRRDGDAG